MPSLSEGLVQHFRARPEAADRQTDTRFSNYVSNLIEIGFLKVDRHLCLRTHLDGVWTHGKGLSYCEWSRVGFTVTKVKLS